MRHDNKVTFSRRAIVNAAIAGAGALSLIAVASISSSAAPVTNSQIAQAKTAEQLQQMQVDQINSYLNGLSTQVQQAQAAAEMAGQNYDAAQAKLTAAQADEAKAKKTETTASTSLDQARASLARIAMMAAQSGTGVEGLAPFLSSNGLDQALNQAEMIQILGTNSTRAVANFATAQKNYQAATASASQATQTAQSAATAATNALNTAKAAANTLTQKQATEQQAQTNAVAVLAQKQNTTKQLIATQLQQQQQAREAAARAAALANSQKNSSSSAGNRVGSTGGGGSIGSGVPMGNSGSTITAAQGEAIVAWAKQQIGWAYVWGGNGPSSGGYDCSGLTSQAYLHAAGKSIPRVANSQYMSAPVHIPLSQLRPGDLLFYGSSPSAIHHVAIYAGGGMMVEAPNFGETVRLTAVRYAPDIYPYGARY